MSQEVSKAVAIADQTPEELAQRVQQGQLDAYSELVKRYEERLFNFMLKKARNYDIAQEITQEAFIRAYEKIHLYNPQWRFSTWLFTIASRLMASYMRKHKNNVSLEKLEHEHAETDDPSVTLAEQEEKHHLWTKAQELLSETQASALWLRYAEQMSIKEVAKVMGKSTVSVRVLLYRARQVLSDHLDAPMAELQPAEAAEPGKLLTMNDLYPRGVRPC